MGRCVDIVERGGQHERLRLSGLPADGPRPAVAADAVPRRRLPEPGEAPADAEGRGGVSCSVIERGEGAGAVEASERHCRRHCWELAGGASPTGAGRRWG